MDLITNFLPRFSVEEAVYTRVEANMPWGLDFIPYRHTKYGIVTEGECYIDLKNDEPAVHLTRGDCYLLPRGDAFRLRDKNLNAAIPFEDTLRLLDGRNLRIGGSGETTVIVGGRYIFTHNTYPPILDLLPPLVHFRVDDTELAALEATIKLLAKETAHPGMGSNAMVDRLADIFFIQSLRAYLLSENQRNIGWLGAVADEKLTAAIRLMHRDTAKSWTLEALAVESGMSRAVFASRFKEKIGIPPMVYLTRLRLNRAQHLLAKTSLSLAKIASEVGYESEAAFNKAFKRERGVPPGEFRRYEREK